MVVAEYQRMQLTRLNAFFLGLTGAYLAPLAIPKMGLDFQYFFVTCLVLLAWFIIRWDRVKALAEKSRRPEMALGLAVIVADYAQNALRTSPVGMADLLVIFLAVVTVFFGLRALKLFWIPAALGAIFLLAYQIGYNFPNYGALQDWLAGVMASMLRALGIGATALGHCAGPASSCVSMNMPNGQTQVLDVNSECTGLQGIILFGLLSILVFFFGKPKMLRIIPVFAVGFAGAFLINIVRLFVVFLTFEFLGPTAGSTMHVYFGYLIFFGWMLVFWALALKYLVPRQSSIPSPMAVDVVW